MHYNTSIPDEVAFYYTYLTTHRIFKPAPCNPHQIMAFSWAPLLAFVYGDHAVLSGHRALLFKANTFVAVALVIERNVPDFMVRLRAYTRPDALNRFINEAMDDFEPVLEHEEADLIKFELIERLIESYIRKHQRKMTSERERLFGTSMLHHISYFRPGSGINWSGSSAIAISYAIHDFYFHNNFGEADILKLSYPIELIYQEGRASGYGSSVLDSGSIMTYRLTDAGLEKMTKMGDLTTMVEQALSGHRDLQDKLINHLLAETFALERHTDFEVAAPSTALEVSIHRLMEERAVVPLLIDTGIPKSTGKILFDLEHNRIGHTWHTQMARVWEDRDTQKIATIEALLEFVDKVSYRLRTFERHDGTGIDTGLWIPAYDRIVDQLRRIETHGFKFTGSGRGGSLAAFVSRAKLGDATHILRRLSGREHGICRYFCTGVTAAAPDHISGPLSRGPNMISVWIMLVLVLSSVTFAVCYVPVSHHLNEIMGRGKSAREAGGYLLWPSAIAFAVVLLPFLYKLYQVGCKVTPPHLRNMLERGVLFKWWIARSVGGMLEASKAPGRGQLVIWLFVVFWSNLVFVSFLVFGFLMAFIGEEAVEMFGKWSL